MSTKWTSTAGPRQTKLVNRAFADLRQRSQSHTEITGIIGGEEHRFTFYSPFEGSSEAGAEAFERVGTKFSWTITRENYKDVIAELERETAALVIPVIDKRRSPEQDTAEKAAIVELNRNHEAKRAEEKAKENVLAAELLKAHPWASQYDSLSRHARAAACLKHLLSAKFPTVKFYVKSSSFSGGDSVDVRWTLGPTTEEVNKIANGFKHGHFDGMQDLYIDDYSPEARAHESVFGRAKYVSVHRENSPALDERIQRDLCAAQHVEYAGPFTKKVFGEGDHDSVDQHAYRMISATSFGPGEEYAGLEHGNENPSLCYNIVKRKVEVAPLALVNGNITVNGNGWSIRPSSIGKPGYIELVFPSKPAQEVLDELKASGFRWARGNACWYGREERLPAQYK